MAQLDCDATLTLDIGAADSGYEGDAADASMNDVEATDERDASRDDASAADAGDVSVDPGSLEDADVDAGARDDRDETGDASDDANGDGSRTSDAFSDEAQDAATTVAPWPGTNAVATVDVANTFGTNLSGLTYQPATTEPAVIWGVRNGPSTLFRLVFDGQTWRSTMTDDWSKGKSLHFVDGSGDPDSEGVSKAEWDSSAVYVSTERDNLAGGTSRLSVLRFDTDAAGATLSATREWNLTADLPAVGANLGLEALTWIPDSFLVAGHFVDESTGQTYDPATYPDHGTGVFIVGLEANGVLYAYVLDHVSGAYHRVATFPSGHMFVMDVQFDRDTGYLWSVCDDNCGNKTGVLELDAQGHFRVVRLFDRPSTLPNVNNEGIAIAPESECSSHTKPFFWTDDNQTDGHALRRDSIPCGRFLDPPRP